MANKVKLQASDGYKNAVKQRETDVFRQRANEIAKEAKKEQNAVSRRRENIIQKRQRQVNEKKIEIALYYSKMTKAQKTIDDGIYSLIGLIVLIAFFAVCIVAFILYRTGHEGSAFGTLIFSCALLVISILIQSVEFEAEKQVREYKEKIWLARKQLEKLEGSLFKGG